MNNKFENEFKKLKHFDDNVDDFVWENINNDLNKNEKKRKKRVLIFFICGLMILIGTYSMINQNKIESNNIVKIIENNFQLSHKNTLDKIELNINIRPIKIEKELIVISETKPLYINYEKFDESTINELKDFVTDIDELYQLKSKISKIEVKKTFNDFKPIELSLNSFENKYKYNLDFNLGYAKIHDIGEAKWAAIQFGKNISERKNVSIGFGIKNVKFNEKYFEDNPFSYSYDSVLAINDKREIFKFYRYDTLINTKIQNLNSNIFHVFVPINFRYKILQFQKLSIDIATEAVVGYQLSKFKTLNTVSGTKTKSSNYYEYYQFVNKFNVTANAGIRANYNLTKRHQVYVYPSFGKNITSIKNQKTGVLIQVNNLNLQFGYNFQF